MIIEEGRIEREVMDGGQWPFLDVILGFLGTSMISRRSGTKSPPRSTTANETEDPKRDPLPPHVDHHHHPGISGHATPCHAKGDLYVRFLSPTVTSNTRLQSRDICPRARQCAGAKRAIGAPSISHRLVLRPAGPCRPHPYAQFVPSMHARTTLRAIGGSNLACQKRRRTVPWRGVE